MANALLQSYTASEYRGRVMSMWLTEQGLNSIGGFIAGLLAAAVGAQWAVGGFAMLLAFLGAMTLAFVPRYRRLE